MDKEYKYLLHNIAPFLYTEKYLPLRQNISENIKDFRYMKNSVLSPGQSLKFYMSSPGCLATSSTNDSPRSISNVFFYRSFTSTTPTAVFNGTNLNVNDLEFELSANKTTNKLPNSFSGQFSTTGDVYFEIYKYVYNGFTSPLTDSSLAPYSINEAGIINSSKNLYISISPEQTESYPIQNRRVARPYPCIVIIGYFKNNNNFDVDIQQNIYGSYCENVIIKNTDNYLTKLPLEFAKYIWDDISYHNSILLVNKMDDELIKQQLENQLIDVIDSMMTSWLNICTNLGLPNNMLINFIIFYL